MAWGESKAWMRGRRVESCTRRCDDALNQPSQRQAKKSCIRKRCRGNVPAGLVKHLLNEQMNTRMENGGRLHANRSAREPIGSTATSRRSAFTSWKAAVTTAPGLRRGDHRHRTTGSHRRK